MPGLGPRLVRWRRPVLALVALLTLGALLTLIDFSDPRDPRPRLRIDPTVDRLLDPNSAARAFQRSTGELFGAEQRAVLAVKGEKAELLRCCSAQIINHLPNHLRPVQYRFW